jgi:hypothetical protein
MFFYILGFQGRKTVENSSKIAHRRGKIAQKFVAVENILPARQVRPLRQREHEACAATRQVNNAVETLARGQNA